MTIPDIINGCFEGFGSAFIWLHIRQVLKDKKVAGVSIIATAFFFSWGIWNLYYYPQLGQWVSFLGGLLIVISNAIWVFLLMKYRHNK